MSATASGTPARPWLIHVDGDLYGDYRTEADQLAALPGAVATGGAVTTSRWEHDRWTEPEPVSWFARRGAVKTTATTRC